MTTQMRNRMTGEVFPLGHMPPPTNGEAWYPIEIVPPPKRASKKADPLSTRPEPSKPAQVVAILFCCVAVAVLCVLGWGRK